MRRFLLMCVTGVAFAFCILSVWVDCDFAKLETEEGSVVSLGLFSLLYRQKECYTYRNVRNLGELENFEFGATGKTAQAMGVLATIFGGVACLLLIFGSCFLSFFSVAKPLRRKLVGGSLLAATIFQSLTFLLLAEVNSGGWCDKPGHDCKLAGAGIWSAVAAGLYLVAGSAFLLLGLQPPKENPGTTFLARMGNNMMVKMGITWKRAWNCRTPDFGLLVFSVVLLAFSLVVLLDCHFYKVTFGASGEYSEGLLFYHYYPDDTCRAFERGGYESFTAATNSSIAFGLIAVLFGAFILWFVWSMIFLVNYPLSLYKALPVLSFFTGICQALTFLANSERNKNLCHEDIEDQHCELGWNGILAAVTTCLYVLFVPGLVWYAKNPNIQLPEEGEGEAGSGLEKEGADSLEQPVEAPAMVQTEDAESPKDE